MLPSHGIELTSAFLDRRAAQILARQRISSATLEEKQDLAAVLHLCGASVADAYARRGFRAVAGERCGEHELAAYLARVNTLKRLFARMQ